MKNHTGCLSSFQLKILAIVCMLIDHTAHVFSWQFTMWGLYEPMRMIGRIAFPIFCFLLVEGFSYTHSKRDYALRLALFCLISEPCYDLAFYHTAFYADKQNVFFTLLIGFALLCILDRLQKSFKEQRIAALIRAVLSAAAIFAACFLAWKLQTDYGYKGVLIILGFYCFREWRLMGLLWMCVINAFAGTRIEGLITAAQTQSVYSMTWKLQDWAVLAIFPILLYNGQRGRSMKWFFYLFYPAHLLILYFAYHTVYMI